MPHRIVVQVTPNVDLCGTCASPAIHICLALLIVCLIGNRLELQTRNNGKLMATLEEVLSRLELSEVTEELLEQADFDDAK